MVELFCKIGTKTDRNIDIILSHTVATAPLLARSYVQCMSVT